MDRSNSPSTLGPGAGAADNRESAQTLGMPIPLPEQCANIHRLTSKILFTRPRRFGKLHPVVDERENGPEKNVGHGKMLSHSSRWKYTFGEKIETKLAPHAVRCRKEI